MALVRVERAPPTEPQEPKQRPPRPGSRPKASNLEPAVGPMADDRAPRVAVIESRVGGGLAAAGSAPRMSAAARTRAPGARLPRVRRRPPGGVAALVLDPRRWKASGSSGERLAPRQARARSRLIAS